MTAMIDDVLAFWFEPVPTNEAEVQERRKLWFLGSPEIDRTIRERFGTLVEQAHAGDLDPWSATDRGALALVILIDQFSRNVHRGTARAFAADARALGVARELVDTGRFARFSLPEKLFVWAPFLHAEDLDAQRRGVKLAVAAALTAAAPWKDMMALSVDVARKHLDVVARFGRFPHRNAILARESTPDEAEYLEFLKLTKSWL
jgi:uncharacterized protein (DUF924 family)